MADKTSAVINYLDPDGKSASKTITNITPYVPESSTKLFCQELMNLTNNTMSSVEIVQRTDITNPKTNIPFKVYPAVALLTTQQAVDNKKTVEIELDYPPITGGWNLPTVSGKKPAGSTVTVVDAHKIVVSDIPADLGANYADMQILITGVIFADSAHLLGTIRIFGLASEPVDIE